MNPAPEANIDDPYAHTVRRRIRRAISATPLFRVGVVRRLIHWAQVIQRVRNMYYERHRRYPRLLRPRGYTEKIQWRKLFDLAPIYTVFCDKIAVRDFIAARVGTDVLTDLLWVGEDPALIPFDRLSAPYIIKSSHASGHYISVADAARLDRVAAVAKCREWLSRPYGFEFSEPGYEFVPRRILVERLLRNADGSALTEYKVFTFDGRVEMIQTVDVANSVSFAFHDRDWRRLRWSLTSPLRPEEFPRPPFLDQLIDLAERISKGFDHLRVDFFDHDRGLRVGEITLYSWSGIFPFNPPEADVILGAHWHIRSPARRAIKAIACGRWEIRPPAKPASTAR